LALLVCFAGRNRRGIVGSTPMSPICLCVPAPNKY